MNSKAGLYFHIPFCKSKCPYCDFFSTKHCEAAEEEYIARLIDEIKKYGGEFDTVYFGGGTPSIIDEKLIGRVLTAAREQFSICENSEITIECNPSKDLSKSFEAYKSYGINRVSIGMQSAVDSERFALGRSAGAKEVEKAITAARAAGIDNISVDLMLGVPKQTLSSLDDTFEFIDKMNGRHISAYMLKIEEGTKFFEMKDRLPLPDEETVCQMYLKTVDALKSLGFEQYEISNFAKKGYESRHNLKYWQLAPYLGIGKTAHSYFGGKRFYYDEQFNLVPDGDGGSEEERIMLGLRLTQGVKKELIKKPCRQYIDAGLMGESEGRVFLTPRGMLVSNTIISELI